MQDGRTCLHIAAGRGRLDVMEILLDHGVDIEAVDNVSVYRTLSLHSLYTLYVYYILGLEDTVALGL